MAEVVVDGLEPVQVEEESRHRPGLSRREPLGKVCNQRAAVVEPGQIIVFSQVPELILGKDAGLYLGEQ